MQSFFSSSQKPVEPTFSPEVLFLLRHDIAEKPLPDSLKDHIELFQLLEKRVEVRELQAEIPAEYIGVRILPYCAGQPGWLEYLQLQTEVVERTTLSFHSLDSSVQIAFETV